MADAEPAPVPVEAPKPVKKRSPNRLVVEEAMNDDNSVPSPGLRAVSRLPGFKIPMVPMSAFCGAYCEDER